MQNFKKIAAELDKKDELRAVKKQFYIPLRTIYMDGNSLGLASKPAERTLKAAIATWKSRGIGGWLSGEHPWFYLAEELGALAAPLLGAHKDEVMITGSASVNLHQILSTFFKPEGRRTKILIEESAFPTDAHIVKGQLILHGLDPKDHLVVVPSKDGTHVNEEDIISRMSDEVAVAVLPVVLYRTSQLLNTKALVAAAHERSIKVCLDACHSFGVLPHNFSAENVDFGVFCTYKYGNGGPGAVGGIFVNRSYHGAHPGLPGWFGSKKEKQFDMANTLDPESNAGAYQIGTPHVLSMAPLLGSLGIIRDAGIKKIRKKSLALTQFMRDMVDTELIGMGFTVATPRAADKHGGHVALAHEHAPSICKALKERGIMPDFRPPYIIRLAPSPLYTSFADVYKTVMALRSVMEEQEYTQFKNTRDVIA
jgi:kynureninase